VTEKRADSAPAIEKRPLPAMIAHVQDDYTVVINRGTDDGIKPGQRFLVYSETNEEIQDPETGKSLGTLEIVKGTGIITHAQDRMATIKSDSRMPPQRRIYRASSTMEAIYWKLGLPEEIVDPGKREPFDDPQVGDKAKPI
jgi:hypothetical protein